MFDSVPWQTGLGAVEPNWKGRSHIVTRADAIEFLNSNAQLVIVEEKKSYGWDRLSIIIYRAFNEASIQTLPVLAQSFLSSNPGTDQTYKLSSWNDNSNSVECLGAGGSGGSAQGSSSAHATGGGAGAYSKITNFAGIGQTISYRIGNNGGAITSSGGTFSAGTAGGTTWWNSATDPGVGTDNTKCSAAGGGAGQSSVTASTTLPGGTAGASSASWGQTKYSGGAGGAINTGTFYSATGGGAPGYNGTGGSGVDATAASQATDGGAATGDTGGTKGTGTLSGNGTSGGNGTVYTTFGLGGGGGASGVTLNGTLQAGSGGNYGAGGGACVNQRSAGSPVAISGAGAQGFIVLTWVPLGRNFGYIIG